MLRFYSYVIATVEEKMKIVGVVWLGQCNENHKFNLSKKIV